MITMEINKPGWETKWANGETEFKTNHHISFIAWLFIQMSKHVCHRLLLENRWKFMQ